MTEKLLGSAAAALVALMLIALPMRAQLPTMSDLDRGGAAPAAGPPPARGVAAVEPPAGGRGSMSWRTTADGLSLAGLPLEQMICSAWDLKPYQVSGTSGWMTGARFDLTAKVSGDDVAAYKKLNGAQRREMLQKLLIERFQLK